MKRKLNQRKRKVRKRAEKLGENSRDNKNLEGPKLVRVIDTILGRTKLDNYQ